MKPRDTLNLVVPGVGLRRVRWRSAECVFVPALSLKQSTSSENKRRPRHKRAMPSPLCSKELDASLLASIVGSSSARKAHTFAVQYQPSMDNIRNWSENQSPAFAGRNKTTNTYRRPKDRSRSRGKRKAARPPADPDSPTWKPLEVKRCAL